MRGRMTGRYLLGITEKRQSLPGVQRRRRRHIRAPQRKHPYRRSSSQIVSTNLDERCPGIEARKSRKVHGEGLSSMRGKLVLMACRRSGPDLGDIIRQGNLKLMDNNWLPINADGGEGCIGLFVSASHMCPGP